MNWKKADKEQLLQIAISEDCPIDYKYRAVSELQDREYRSVEDENLQRIIYLFGKGLMISEIANLIGLSDYKVQLTVEKYGLWKTRLYSELRKTEPSKGRAVSYYNGKRAVY